MFTTLKTLKIALYKLAATSHHQNQLFLTRVLLAMGSIFQNLVGMVEVMDCGRGSLLLQIADRIG